MPEDRVERNASDLAERLARSYSALIRGFNWLGSEGDDPYRAFSAPFAPAAKLTPETFRAAAGIGRSWSIELKPAAPWFAQTIQYFHDGQYGSDDDHAIEIVYIHLLQAMGATLEGPLQFASVHYAPKDESTTFHKARYYIFGRVAGGGLAGLIALSVET
jgi:hypothetical protein